MLNILFWILMSLSITALAINFTCSKFLEIVIILLFIDFITVFLMVLRKDEGKDNVQNYISMKLGAIENMCNHIFQKVFTPETAERLKNEEKNIVEWLEKF